MTNPAVNTSEWVGLASTVNNLLMQNTGKGLLVIFLSLFIFFSLMILSTWIVIKIIRVNKEKAPILGKILNTEQFSLNIIKLTEDITRLVFEGRELSSKHEKILEHSILRDQMTIVDNDLDMIKSELLLKFASKLRQKYPESVNSVFELPVFRVFENSLSFTIGEIAKFFKRIAKENHLADQSEEEFQAYMTQKIEAVKKFSLRIFESVYSSESIGVCYLLEKFEDCWPEYQVMLRKILFLLRSISIKYLTQVDAEEKEFKEKWSNFINNLSNNLMSGVIDQNE